ncbi:MAG: Protein kinase domain protein [Acidobacteria bacterium]|nr:Protein kinase domain protein [Acidobacteriota bacterium]
MTDQHTGQILANKYRIDSFLRESDLGAVYRGTHVSMDKPVTVKILSPALAVDDNIVRRFSDEARTVSRISHPNVLNVTDFGSDKGNTVYIVYEGADGETLKTAVRREGQFSPERAINITRQIASALSTAHAAGVVHHNLSSENILLTRTANNAEMVKVLDLGSVKPDDHAAIEENSIAVAEYLSPEQCSGTGEVDSRSDVYSLGVILYQMLAGEVPFTGAKATDVMLKHVQEPPPPLSAFRHDLLPEIEPLVLQALAKNPDMRFQTIDEFANALARVSGNYEGQETVVIPGTAAEEPVNNNVWKTAFVVLAGISLLAIGMIYATSVKQTDPATQMKTDANGQPVQPINPATGLDEQSLSNLATMPAEVIGNANMMAQPPGTIPGGDGYNPWGGSGPPPGAPPMNFPQGGQVITIDPNNPSQFIPQDGNIILVPIPANTNVNAAVKPSPTPKGNNANGAPSPAPNATPKATPETKPTQPKTEKTPAKPAEQQKASPPAATEKRSQSGTEQESRK